MSAEIKRLYIGCREFVFSGHAVKRMFERRINDDDIKTALSKGEIIEEYPDDIPYPSFLVLGMVGGRYLHVVAGLDEETKTCYIITVYEPDPESWDPDFKVRK